MIELPVLIENIIEIVNVAIEMMLVFEPLKKSL